MEFTDIHTFLSATSTLIENSQTLDKRFNIIFFCMLSAIILIQFCIAEKLAQKRWLNHQRQKYTDNLIVLSKTWWI